MSIEWNKVIYADCMNDENGLPTLEDKSIDLCLTDPPYNINYKGTIRGSGKKNTPKIKGKYFYDDDNENYPSWCESWFVELKRICNNIIFSPGNQNLHLWFDIEEPRDIAIWYKINAAGIGACYWFTTHEFILFYGKFGNRRLNHSVIPALVNYDYKTLSHPTPKPRKVWEDILKTINPTSVIDPFLGSGTTAEVCTKLGIKWLGYEINEVYSQDINKRLKNCVREPQIKPLEEWL